ncbi:unnamed protein product [Lampetra fluviatilis]
MRARRGAFTPKPKSCPSRYQLRDARRYPWTKALRAPDDRSSRGFGLALAGRTQRCLQGTSEANAVPRGVARRAQATSQRARRGLSAPVEFTHSCGQNERPVLPTESCHLAVHATNPSGGRGSEVITNASQCSFEQELTTLAWLSRRPIGRHRLGGALGPAGGRLNELSARAGHAGQVGRWWELTGGGGPFDERHSSKTRAPHRRDGATLPRPPHYRRTDTFHSPAPAAQRGRTTNKQQQQQHNFSRNKKHPVRSHAPEVHAAWRALAEGRGLQETSGSSSNSSHGD